MSKVPANHIILIREQLRGYLENALIEKGITIDKEVSEKLNESLNGWEEILNDSCGYMREWAEDIIERDFEEVEA